MLFRSGLYVYYSTNNGSNWYQIGYESPPATSYPYWKTCTLTLPPAAHTTSTMLLFTQTYSSGSTYDVIRVDDISLPMVSDTLVSPDTLTTYENAASEFVDFSVKFFNSQSSPFSVLSVDSAFITGQDSLDVTYLSGLPVQLLAGQNVDVHFRFQPRHDTSRLRRDFTLNLISDGKDFQNICNSDSVTSINRYGYARALLDTVAPNIAVKPIILPLDSLGGAILYIEDVDIGTTD